MPLAPGDAASLRKTITDADVQQFAALSGDANTLHLDEAYAQNARFGQRICHGMLYAALISAVIGNQLPGPGTVYISQSLQFLKPVFRDVVGLALLQREWQQLREGLRARFLRA